MGKEKSMNLRKRFLSILLAAAMLISMLPSVAATAYASDYDEVFDISPNPENPINSYVQIEEAGNYLITGVGGVLSSISVAPDMPGDVFITLDNVTITDSNFPPFSIGSGTAVYLTLIGTNKLESNDCPGLTVQDGAILIITEDSTGSLTATGGDYSAGIGSDALDYDIESTIVIRGGNITATGGKAAAGIGWGSNNDGGNITIEGGTVSAQGGKRAAGIGGGSCFNGGTISISGGDVTASGGIDGVGIGGGDKYGLMTVNGVEIPCDPLTGCAITISGGTVRAMSDIRAMSDMPDLSNYTPHTVNASEYEDCSSTVTYIAENNDDYLYLNITPFNDTLDLNDSISMPSNVTFNNKVFTVHDDSVTPVTVIGTTALNRIAVDDGVTGLTLILEDADITNSDASPLSLLGTADVTVQSGDGTDNELNASGGIDIAALSVPSSAAVTITGGSQGTGNLTATGGTGGAGIGSYGNVDGGTITIKGGNIEANGGTGGAGIGSGREGDGGTITIKGGNIEATGGTEGAAIGIGREGDGGTITINGGNIEATGDTGIGGAKGDGSTITINAGTVTATGGSGAGIGGGCYEDDNHDYIGGSGGTITINGGIVTASSSLSDIYAGHGAGIGGGVLGDGGTIVITGGYVSASGSGEPLSETGGAGIGGGRGGSGGNITISGGIITASGSGPGGAGIGGGSGGQGIEATGGSIFISGGKVEAHGVDCGAGIGGGSRCNGGIITISGGDIIAQGGNNAAGIGSGDYSLFGSSTIHISGGRITATGGYGATAIGGGSEGGNGGNISFGGGTVVAVGGEYLPGENFAGIGGSGGSVATICISGGSIQTDSWSGTLQNSITDNTPVYITAVTLDGITTATAIKSLTTSLNVPYGTTDMDTDASGKLYLYLPAGTLTTSAKTALYAYTGAITTTIDSSSSLGTLTADTTVPTVLISSTAADATNASVIPITITFSESVTGFTAGDLTIENGSVSSFSGSGTTYTANVTPTSEGVVTVNIAADVAEEASGNGNTAAACFSVIYDVTAPVVLSISPSGTTAAASGSVSVTFNEAMGATAGTVSLNSGAKILTGGSWSADAKTYTVPYSSLSHSTSYAVTISGFADAAGNIMDIDSGRSFTVSGGSTGGNPGSSGESSSSNSTITVTTENNTRTVSRTFTASTGLNGVAAASVPSTQISEMLTAVEDGAASNAQTVVVIQVETGSGATGISVTIPQAAVTALKDSTSALTISSSIATVKLSSAALTEISKQTSGDITITATAADTSVLSEESKTAIGTRPVYDLKITSGSTTVSSFGGGTATVLIPYTPAAGEDVNAIVVYYVNASGELVIVPNCVYDAKTGTVTFTTTHFSTYAVGYCKVSFSDVPDSAWYRDAVGFIAARSITAGTGNGKFSPDAKLTRGDFIAMLMKAYGITPDTNPADNFADAGSTYYTGYLAAAKRLGISSGIGNNMYAPGKEVTRQEMFTLLHNSLKIIGQIPQGSSGKSLTDFTDAGQINSWAKDAVDTLVDADVIAGSNGKLSPKNTTTRAEMSQVLYNLLSK